MSVMDLQGFKAALDRATPPEGLGRALEALWWAGKGDWNRAHELAQEDASAAGSWVHAYLHRVEGDAANAGYWYRRAGRPPASVTLEQEWAAIASELLGGG